VVRCGRSTDSGACYDHRQLKIESNATVREEVLAAKEVRTLIAHQLDIDIKRVTDEAHASLMILGPTGSTAWN
jgi:hypothetical protein